MKGTSFKHIYQPNTSGLFFISIMSVGLCILLDPIRDVHVRTQSLLSFLLMFFISQAQIILLDKDIIIINEELKQPHIENNKHQENNKHVYEDHRLHQMDMKITFLNKDLFLFVPLVVFFASLYIIIQQYIVPNDHMDGRSLFVIPLHYYNTTLDELL
ncbi:hypothetical protein ACJX0J_005353, partial [Zea mays]